MSRTSTRTRARRGAAGFTLTEVMISLVLLGIVMGAMMTVLARQQRFYRGANDLMQTRTQVRQVAGMLPSDLRGISSSDTRNGTDIYEASDKAIEFRSIFGSSLICRKLSATRLILPPVDLAKGTNLTVWQRIPVVGDSMLVYDDSVSFGNADDHWEVYKITDVLTVAATSADACGVASGLVQAADVTAGRVSYELRVAAGASTQISSTIRDGAPIRFFSRRRYELYQPSNTSGWYLGRSECDSNTGVCPALSPVSGPFTAYSANAAISGLSFVYYNAAGAAFTPTGATASKALITRVQIAARADTKDKVDMGRQVAVVRDSLSQDVALRNRQ